MKLSSRTIVSSSPNRIEKFPTAPHLLSRFSRSSGASRSRGRSRSGPIFFSTFARRKTASESIETPEPSSPKVTCIGQVRVRRSKAPKPTTAAHADAAQVRASSFCGWLHTALFGKCFAGGKRSSSPLSKSLRRLLFVSVGKAHRKEVLQEEPTAVLDLDPRRFKSDSDSEEAEEEEKDGEPKIFVASTPPKNALLLMRCRSEPRRASALADRFWGSPSESPAAEDDALQKGIRPPAVGNGSSPPAPMKRKEEREEEQEEEEKVGQLAVSSRPFMLTRCKSEPSTRTANLLLDEACLWRKQKLGFAVRCQSPHAYLD